MSISNCDRLLSQIIMRDTAGLIKQLTGPFTWQPKLKRFRASKNNYLDISEMRAYSYNWWCYFTAIDGIGIFNEYRYSMTTAGHQSRMKALLFTLGIDIHYTVRTSNSIAGWNLLDVMQNLKNQQAELQDRISALVWKKSAKRSSFEFKLTCVNDDIAQLADTINSKRKAA